MSSPPNLIALQVCWSVFQGIVVPRTLVYMPYPG